jgi:hypothetical protein
MIFFGYRQAVHSYSTRHEEMEDAAFVIQSSSSPSSAMHDIDGLWDNIAEIRMKKVVPLM